MPSLVSATLRAMSLDVNYVREGGGPVRVKFSGAVDEHAKVQELLGAIAENAVLDLAGIDRINSIGLLHWLRGMASLTERHKVSVQSVPYQLSLQANRMLDLFGKAELLSCLAPYFCGTCNSNCEVEVSTQEVLRATGAAPGKRCPTCGAEMDFDEMDEYFTFLREPGT